MIDVALRWTDDETVTGRLVDGSRSPGFLLAHGAGAGQDHPGVAGLREGLAKAGFPVLTFNYPYMEAGKRRPDSRRRLLACHRAALAWLRAETRSEVVLAGRSMGGRMGSYLASEGEQCAALVCYAYPLHPAGRPDELRAEHLTAIRVPMLFVSGSRDALARLDLVDSRLRSLPTATVAIIEGADHSFRVPKRSGVTYEQTLAAVAARTVEWIESI